MVLVDPNRGGDIVTSAPDKSRTKTGQNPWKDRTPTLDGQTRTKPYEGFVLSLSVSLSSVCARARPAFGGLSKKRIVLVPQPRAAAWPSARNQAGRHDDGKLGQNR